MEVIVQDANNIVIEVDQGRQGRGVEDVSLVTVGADYYLLFTFTDGTTEQVGPISPIVTEVLFAEVRNAEAVTILKGQPVYLFAAQGNLATVKLAFNTSDATSAKTLGLAAENIAPNAQGLVTCQGTLDGLNTSAYNEGDTLYLGATAGTLTNVKPQAPNHLVYVGVVERANAGAGQIYVRVQNGYELDEIHDVQIINPVNGNTLIYDAATDLWKNAGITAGSGISVTNGASSITVGNTGVLSFSGGTTGLTPATATTGAVSLAGTLSTANGGTGLSSYTANRVLYASSTSAIGQSANLTFDGTTLGSSALNITGNTTLGDATTDTVQVNGYMGVGGAANSARAIDVESTALTGSNQIGIYSSARASSAATSLFRSFSSFPRTEAASFILDTLIGYAAADSSKGAGSTITNLHGLYVYDQTQGTNNYGITSLVSSGTNKWNIYASGTAANYFAGNVQFAAGAAATPSLTRFGDENTGFWFPAADTLAASTGGSERMRLDSSGNLGLGVTPSAWSVPTLQLPTQFAVGQLGVSKNAYYDGVWKYITTGLASVYQQGAGIHTWYNAPSGTAGNAITFTQAMTLDASGNLGIGTAAPGARLDVSGTVAGVLAAQIVNLSASSSAIARLRLDSLGGAWLIDNNRVDGSLTIGNGSERLRIGSTGNFLVGTTTNTNSSLLTVNGTISETVSSVQYIVASQFDVGTAPNKIPLNQYLGSLAYQNASAIAGQAGFSAGTAALPSIASATDLTTGRWFPAAGVMAWSTGGTERMRLDGSGNLGLGVTPVAWNVGYRALDMGAGAFMAQPGASDCYILQNAYFDTGWKYRYSSTLAARYSQISGVHSWSNAPSGTAGNAISFTQAMTLDASGNLLLGTTTPVSGVQLTVNGGASISGYKIVSESGFGTFRTPSSMRLATDANGIDLVASGFGVTTFVSGIECARVTSTGNQSAYQPGESAQNTSVTLTAANLQARIITSNAAVTLTLPTGTTLEGYMASMTTNTAFECTFIATTANAITIAANGNTTVGNLTVSGNTSGTFRFRKTAANTFTVYRVA